MRDAADRALGALYGLAIGDALGMPTQDLDRASARRILGSPPGFRDGPPENAISRGLPAGSITDDTMQALIVARLLVDGGGTIDPRKLADALLAWELDMAARGRLELLGPSTKRALAAVARGEDPRTTGGTGTTNGAAMRITPVGIATPPERLIAAVVGADVVTHDTAIAHAGAAAVAAVVSAGVGGANFEEALPRAIEAAAMFGHASMFEGDRLQTGVETAQSVPTAFAVARRHREDVWMACTTAAMLGGDSDTIAAISGAMVGACVGLSALPPDAVKLVRDVNQLDFEPLAFELLKLRSR